MPGFAGHSLNQRSTCLSHLSRRAWPRSSSWFPFSSIPSIPKSVVPLLLLLPLNLPPRLPEDRPALTNALLNPRYQFVAFLTHPLQPSMRQRFLRHAVRAPLGKGEQHGHQLQPVFGDVIELLAPVVGVR